MRGYASPLLSNIVASRVRSSGVSVDSAAAMAFRSGVLVVFKELVQAVVQAARGVGVTSLLLGLTTEQSLVRDQEVAGSNPVTPIRLTTSLRIMVAAFGRTILRRLFLCASQNRDGGKIGRRGYAG